MNATISAIGVPVRRVGGIAGRNANNGIVVPNASMCDHCAKRSVSAILPQKRRLAPSLHSDLSVAT
jgi:hypothetical protein